MPDMNAVEMLERFRREQPFGEGLEMVTSLKGDSHTVFDIYCRGFQAARSGMLAQPADVVERLRDGLTILHGGLICLESVEKVDLIRETIRSYIKVAETHIALIDEAALQQPPSTVSEEVVEVLETTNHYIQAILDTGILPSRKLHFDFQQLLFNNRRALMAHKRGV